MNDNASPDYREKLIGRVLADTVVMEEHLTKGLTGLLRESGCTPEYQGIIQRFIEPVLARLREMEGQVIRQVQKEQLAESREADATEARASQLEFYADEFTGLADTVQQMRLAARFREFVEGLTGPRGQEQVAGMEPNKDKNHER